MQSLEDLRILHTEILRGWGGQESRVLAECLAMKALGAQVYFSCRPGSVLAEKLHAYGIETLPLPYRSNADLKTLWALVRFIKAKQINIVNTHSGKDTWVGGLAAKIAGVKFIRTRHMSLPINPARTNFINELADYVITTGESVKENMIRHNRIKPDRIESIPSGQDDSRFDPALYPRDAIRAQLNIPDDAVCIGNLANIRSEKRLDIFIQVALNLHQEFPHALFLLAGKADDKLADTLKAFIAEHQMENYVRILGETSHPEEFLAALDVFMLTSESEGISQSLMQAMLMGKACISTNVGGIPDLQQGNNLLLTDCHVDQLTAALRSVLADPQKMHTLQTQARGFVAQEFSQRRMIEKLSAVYRKLL